MKYFENNLNVINQTVANEIENFQSNTLWNLMVERYFVLFPETLKSNPQVIFENLQNSIPENQLDEPYNDIFVEKIASLSVKPLISIKGNLTSDNVQNSKKIIENFIFAIKNIDLPELVALK